MKARRWSDRFAWSWRLHLILRALNDHWQLAKNWFITPDASEEEAIDREYLRLARRAELLERRRKMSVQEARLNATRARRQRLRMITDTSDCA